MDLNDFRAGFTLLSFVIFIALAWHTWNRRRALEHADAAQLIFQGESTPDSPEFPQASRSNKDANHG